jgi:hypothetical protein
LLSIEDGVLFNGTLEMTQAVRDVTHEISLHAVDDPDASPLRRAMA